MSDKNDYDEGSLRLHARLHGKLATVSRVPIRSMEDLSIAYTPGVAEPCRAIADDPDRARELTMKHNSIAVVSDGSAVLGLGDIGPLAGLPVMEGKAILFREFAGLDAIPLCLDVKDEDELVRAVEMIAPTFGGINLEDIAAPRCFEVEKRLQDVGIPVFHDDQHGTAIVTLAAMFNAARITGRDLSEANVVMSGAGAAGVAIAKMLCGVGYASERQVAEVILCDSSGVIHDDRDDLSASKRSLLEFTNREGRTGSLEDVLEGADVFIGVSAGGLLEAGDIGRMNDDPIVLAMANPEPEIMPDEAKKGGAAVVCTGRSDFPNQVNNVLAFPGVFRGALDASASSITPEMKLAAARALADHVGEPKPDHVLPSPLDRAVAYLVAARVAEAAGT